MTLQHGLDGSASDEGNPRPWPSGVSVAIGRARGTVTVRLRGTLDDCATEPLGRLLGDLVDNQGNRTVVIDLRCASGVSAAVREVFAALDASARGRGSRLCLHESEDGRPVPEGHTFLLASQE